MIRLIQNSFRGDIVYDRYKVLEHFEANKDFFENTIYPNIEKYRKGDIKINIKDLNGNIVPNAKIKVKQTKHEFKFGANLFMLDELETNEKNKLYREYFKRIFNRCKRCLSRLWINDL